MSTEKGIPLAPVGSLAKPQRPKSKSLRPCRCPKQGCGKMFSKRSNLKAHMRVHSGVLPYPCEFPGCTKRFRWKSSLKPHVKVHLASGRALNGSPCSSENFAASKANQPSMSQKQEETSPAMPTNVRNNQVRPFRETIFWETLLSLPPQSFLTEIPTDADSSLTRFIGSPFFEAAQPDKIQHSRQYYCTFSGCGERFSSVSMLLEHEKLTGHLKMEPQVAQALFPDSHNQATSFSGKDIDLTCNSALSESQASCETDVLSLTLDSCEDWGNVPITDDLWKHNIKVMDPFVDPSINFEPGSNGMEVLSSAACGPGVSTMNPQDAIYLPVPKWAFSLTGTTASSTDFTASPYIE